MPIHRGIPEAIQVLDATLQSKVDAIVYKADRLDQLWRQQITYDIRTLLHEYSGYKHAAKRILFGANENGDQVFFGTFECWGDKLVLFVPSSTYAPYLSFVQFSKAHENLTITVTGYGFTTNRSEFDNSFFFIRLGDSSPGPNVLRIEDEGGTTILEIPTEQRDMLYSWFNEIFSSQ
jgi:hypothetical protein